MTYARVYYILAAIMNPYKCPLQIVSKTFTFFLNIIFHNEISLQNNSFDTIFIIFIHMFTFLMK